MTKTCVIGVGSADRLPSQNWSRQHRDFPTPTSSLDRSRAVMVHRLHDIRLLENLEKSEKEYSAALVHLFGLSHTSIASLSAYGAASSPTTSQAILSVAAALAGADEAFRSYTASIDDWTEKLKEIKRLESEIENMARDREILQVIHLFTLAVQVIIYILWL